MGLSMLFLRQENVRGISVLTWKLLYFPLACGSGGNSLLWYLQALPLFSKFKLLLLLLLQRQLNKCWWAREGETGQHPASAPAAGGEPCSKQMLGDFHSSQSPTPLSSRGISSYSFAHWIKQEGSSQEYGHFITCIWRSDREKNPVCADVYMCLYIYNVLFKMTSFLRLKQTNKKEVKRKNFLKNVTSNYKFRGAYFSCGPQTLLLRHWASCRVNVHCLWGDAWASTQRQCMQRTEKADCNCKHKWAWNCRIPIRKATGQKEEL